VKVLRPFKLLFALLTLAAIAFGLTGCASTDPDNYSGRPWNTPKTWEGGMPSGIMEGR